MRVVDYEYFALIKFKSESITFTYAFHRFMFSNQNLSIAQMLEPTILKPSEKPHLQNDKFQRYKIGSKLTSSLINDHN